MEDDIQNFLPCSKMLNNCRLLLFAFAFNCRFSTRLFLFVLCQLKGVFAKNERGYRLNAIKSAFDRY